MDRERSRRRLPEDPPGRYPARMENTALFGAALGLVDPWYVATVSLDTEQRQLELGIDFRRGGTFACPECGALGCKAYDTDERRWRHLDFFQYRSEIVARTPRVSCPTCGVHPVAVPWARPGSGFTLLFEALVLTMAPHMALAAVARIVDEHDTRLWRLLDFHVQEARAARDDGDVRVIGVDETAARRGHQYITLVADLEAARVLFATPGKDAETITAFREDFEAHGGVVQQIEEIAVDMSTGFRAGIAAEFPDAETTFDKFHVMQLVNRAVDETRRAERAESPALRAQLKGHRYDFLRNPETMSDDQLGFIAELLSRQRTLKTAKAFHLKLVFQDFFLQPQPAAEAFLTQWCAWAQRSRLPEMVKLAGTIRAHWTGILRWFVSGITTSKLEAINSLVQSAKARARGYRNVDNLITMTYLIAGRLDFDLPALR